MSTKIFQGFRMQSASFTEVLQTVDAFRPWAMAEAEKLMAAFLAKLEPEKGAPGTNGYCAIKHNLARLPLYALFPVSTPRVSRQLSPRQRS